MVPQAHLHHADLPVQAEGFWVRMHTESGFVAHRNEVKGIGATTLLGGGKRPIVGPTGFDFASAVKP